MHEDPIFSTFSSTLAIVYLLDYSHLGGCDDFTVLNVVHCFKLEAKMEVVSDHMK